MKHYKLFRRIAYCLPITYLLMDNVLIVADNGSETGCLTMRRHSTGPYLTKLVVSIPLSLALLSRFDHY